MGFFDDIFGGFFDFNGDGKTTWDEEWIAYKILEDINKEDEPDNASHSIIPQPASGCSSALPTLTAILL